MNSPEMPPEVWADYLEEQGLSVEDFRAWLAWGIFCHDWWDSPGESEHGWGFHPTSGDGHRHDYHTWEEEGYGAGSCVNFGNGDVLEKEGEQAHGESLNVYD